LGCGTPHGLCVVSVTRSTPIPPGLGRSARPASAATPVPFRSKQPRLRNAAYAGGVSVRPERSERPRIFLSYAHEDEPRARSLAEMLEEQGAVTWSASSLPVGSPVAREIGDAMHESDAVLVLSSPATRRSTAVGSEVAAAVAERLADDRKLVVPVLLGDDDDIAPLLRDTQALDLRPPQDQTSAVRNFVSQLRLGETPARTVEDAQIALEDAYRQLMQAELAHRVALEARRQEYEVRLQRRGQVVAAVLTLLAAITGLVLAAKGATSASVAIYVALFSALATTAVMVSRGRTGRGEP
jgi:TIR domain